MMQPVEIPGTFLDTGKFIHIFFSKYDSMKHTSIYYILLLLCSGIPAFSQTPELENQYMMNEYLSGGLTQIEFRDKTFAWRDLIDSTGYPLVPYDSLGKKVEYTFISSLEGIPRETIVNRISEWAAVSFGSTNGLVTRQGNTSRLILNGSMEVLFPDMFLVYKNAWRGYVETERQNSSLCFFTMVFTVKDGRMRSQFLNLSYEYTDYVSDRTISRSLNSCFPISENEQGEWKAIITLVNETAKNLAALVEQLNTYIRDFENDYSW